MTDVLALDVPEPSVAALVYRGPGFQCSTLVPALTACFNF